MKERLIDMVFVIWGCKTEALMDVVLASSF